VGVTIHPSLQPKPVPAQPVERLIAHLHQLALDGQDDVQRGVGSGAWLSRRALDARVCRQAAELIAAGDTPHRFTTHSFSVVESTMRTCEDLKVRCRVTSKVELSDEFYTGCGWQIEMFPDPQGGQ
jgi:hypothetical protein